MMKTENHLMRAARADAIQFLKTHHLPLDIADDLSKVFIHMIDMGRMEGLERGEELVRLRLSDYKNLPDRNPEIEPSGTKPSMLAVTVALLVGIFILAAVLVQPAIPLKKSFEIGLVGIVIAVGVLLWTGAMLWMRKRNRHVKLKEKRQCNS